MSSDPVSASRDRAVERSLERARSRAEEKVQRFLDATIELLDDRGGLDFTLQDVVDRSGQSLRSFYQFFGSKDHLLLAVAEEGMRDSAEHLREIALAGDDPLDRVRLYVVTLHEWCERDPIDMPPSPHRSVRSLADFLFDLLVSDPERAAAASAPLYDLLVELMGAAQEQALIRNGHLHGDATRVLQTVMFNAFATPVEGGQSERRALADELWSFCLNGIAPE